MKHIVKRASLEAFESWKAQANADWTPTFDNLRKPEKPALHEALLGEQGWVCCYCGRSIDAPASHIEHFRPQTLRPDLALEYSNLLASCIRETEPGLPLHCGQAKGDAFDEQLHISPMDEGCESRFSFTLLGEIISTTEPDSAVDFMVETLQLNTASLRNRREAALLEVFDPAFLASVSQDELIRLRDGYRRPDADGKLPNFGHVIARYAEQRLADSLT